MAGFKLKIPARRVRKDNSNIRRYSDELWRALRKCRWKKSPDHENMDKFESRPGRDEYFKQKHFKQVYGTNGYDPFEPFVHTQHYAPTVDIDFAWTLNSLANRYMTQRQKRITEHWLMGNMKQQDIATSLRISQSTVSNELKVIKDVLKRHYVEG